MICPARWYDGVTAIRHDGSVRLQDATSIALVEEGEDDVFIHLSDLAFVETRGSETIFRRQSNADFRLTLVGEIPPLLAAKLPAKTVYGGWIDKIGLGKAAVAFGAISLVVSGVVLTAPDWLGPRIPPSWERKLGDAMIGDLGNRLCSTPESDAAMAKLLDAVDPADIKVRAGIANVDMVNAVALPGGQVLLFDGFIQEAETPEELAGVLGHEVGHVRERHVMTAVLRQFGLTILLGGADSTVANNIAGIASQGYSRDAEREADEYAREQMERAEISPVGAANFFERIMGGDDADDAQDLLSWASSHPAPGERADNFRDAVNTDAEYRPALTDAEFEALKNACVDDPDVESWDIF